ncbi:hypothetical protein C7974DRAFT_434556 [Boeremia exigua]|uniref:uncharacterized protein n=1 Tax=Boeremia exigua TaxID=749465 RepID=UPI001E8E8B86|nr:uncharacterized protein C7974DRAFT_434556 [Boeremia exigua]KAH6625476.1 hypothetical protein C7974DRAFT_434556 [Boeremia exigua]
MIGYLLQLALLLPVLTLSTPFNPSAAPAFEGRATKANPLRPKTRYSPGTMTFHRDSGNTRTDDYLGPLGQNIQVASTKIIKPSPLFWDDEGRLTAGGVCNETTDCIVALDPDTFEIKATWMGTTANGSQIFFPYLAYSSFYQGRLVTPAIGPRVLEIQRTDSGNHTEFQVVRETDLSSIVGNNSQVFNSAFDAEGNLWFTTGGFPGFELGEIVTSVIIGYLTPAGVAHYIDLPNTSVENAFALSGSIVYVLTGPAGSNDHANATGHLYALQATSEGDGVKIIYKEEYDAGDSVKPGGVARGSGSSPGLLGDEYVAFTDNANGRINTLFFKQVKETSSGSNLVCKAPMFAVNASSTDNAIGGYFNGETYSVFVTNMYGAPTVISPYNSSASVDSPSQNVSMPASGLARVDFDPVTGLCKTTWEVDLRATGIPTLSTASGLVYQYSQDPEQALNGSYAWYFTAIDYRTGEIVWRVCIALGPDGAVYSWVSGGVVKIYDGDF